MFLLYLPTLEALGIGLVCVLITGCPIGIYLWIGWPWKRDEIFNSMNAGAKDIYLHNFRKESSDLATAEIRFKKFYEMWYGQKIYIVPTILVICFSAALGICLGGTALHGLMPEQGSESQNEILIYIPTVAAGAVSGAFTFVAWDLTSRAARRNMSWDDVLLGALRLAVCVPVGYMFALFLKDQVAPFVAFAIAALPIGVLATLVNRILRKTYNLDIADDTKHDQLTKLPGIDASISDRIEEADITTIGQLAYCDPIQLAMRTNLGFTFVLDIVSEALAWIYVGEKLEILRARGLRGSYEFAVLASEIAAENVNSDDVASQSAAAIGLSRSEFINVQHQVGDDPYTSFIVKVFS